MLQRPPDLTGVMTGTISDGVHSIAISADRANPLNSKKNPARKPGGIQQFCSSTLP
jgi:hypothetical protein